MRMGTHAGFKIAMEPNNKSFRSAYRHFRHNTCMIDLSYYHCLTIRNLKGNICNPPNIIRKNSSQTLNKFS